MIVNTGLRAEGIVVTTECDSPNPITDALGNYQFEGSDCPDSVLDAVELEGGISVQAAGYLSANRSFIVTPPYPYTADDTHLIPAE